MIKAEIILTKGKYKVLTITMLLIICIMFTIVIEYIPIVKFLNVSKKYFIATNVLTNVLANVIVSIYDILSMNKQVAINRIGIIMIVEVLVVISESILYMIYLKSRGNNKTNYLYKNVALVVFANVLSFFLGNEIFKIIAKFVRI